MFDFGSKAPGNSTYNPGKFVNEFKNFPDKLVAYKVAPLLHCYNCTRPCVSSRLWPQKRKKIKKFKQLELQIAGYHGTKGTEKNNRKLCRKRAEAVGCYVAKYLIYTHAIKNIRLKLGCGKRSSGTENRNAAARWLNVSCRGGQGR